MRIALFTETFVPNTDGIVTRLTHTIDQLMRAGDEVMVIAPAAHGQPESYHGARVMGAYSFKPPFYPQMRFGLPMPRRTLARALRQFAPQVVHAVNPVSLGLGAVYFARRRRIPLVASYHANLAAFAHRYHLGLLERPGWAYLRALHNLARLNLCTSRPVQADLAARGFRRLALWDPGVDAEQFHPDHRAASWRERLTGGHAERTLILSVGRLAKEKHLEALAPALAALPGCHLAIVGDGPHAAALRHTFAGLPATFVGPLHGAELAAAYASADLFIMPSPTETLGLVVIEAMAAGLPVVAARRGGIPDLVVDGATGMLYDYDEAGALAGALRIVAGDPLLRLTMGAAGRRRAERWSWRETTARLRERYTEVAASSDAA
ncbi:MAG TPA: glycosyltransferase family 1 protein [Ktedonobacterales bacterium]|nr:glycosyltransferase family 1 protein [Ktedonobacterales bacterium]